MFIVVVLLRIPNMSYLTVSGSDYLNSNQTLTFSPTTLSHTVRVLASTDAIVENEETFIVSASYAGSIPVSTTVSIADQTSE